ncbi:MAG: hypothetical protein QOF76_2331, partial [Solirubrobacteraceae bacterium]|nr:hypothetical protein [Solirubrobacteraceae bacterium]
IGEIEAYRRRLGAAANALRLGIAIIRIPPGKRPNPPHSHADEEEQFFVLEGSGLSYQTSGAKDVRTYTIRAGDFIRHPAGGDAHTLIAGPEGLTVLVVAEGSRTSITWLPRTKQFWLGSRWVPADSPPPFVADSQLPPLEIPEPIERPPSIRNLDELEVWEGRDGRYAYASRWLVDRDDAQIVLAHDQMPPDTFNTELHFHSTREEAWYVRSGIGTARIGDTGYDLRPGSFFLRRPNGGVGHRVEVGAEGMELITMGDLIPADVAVYPERGVARIAAGVEIPYTPK